ncbi:MAG: Gfo/Idh/MocA family oxidoreductase [Clostridiales bacterium]|nr:Gfo/Idh/MocA family oxidoreductase [Clostridiales bacterium]
MDQVRVGIIGIGNMGSGHARSITGGQVAGMALCAVADINPDRLKWAEENLPGALRFDSAEAMMESGAIDAVIVATPHYFHPTYVAAALKKGLHAMCEKPAGVYTKAVREVNELAARSQATYAIMFNQRTNSVYKKLRELVQGGELGRVRRANWLITNWYRPQSYYDSGAWRATWSGEGGGVLLNQCPHNLDLWQWILGMPVRVRAFAHEGKWHDIEVEDDVTAYMEYENGATGVFITSTGDAPGTNRLEIALDGGKLVCDGSSIRLYKLEMPEPEFSRTYRGGFGEPRWELIDVETDGDNPQHVGVLRAFAAHILRGEPLVAPGEEGIRGLTLSNAMHLSSWLDRTVTLPLDEELFLKELNRRRASSRRKEGASVTLDTANTYNA